jgi:hypothetical protein
MRVCDCCRDMTKPVVELYLAILKPDSDSNRIRPKPIKSRDLEICESCVQVLWDSVLTAISSTSTKDSNHDHKEIPSGS